MFNWFKGAPILQADSNQFAYFGHEGTLECSIDKEPKADVILNYFLDFII